MKKPPSFQSVRLLLRAHKQALLLVGLGFLGGLLWLSAMRFFLVQPTETHYHANFAVFIQGEREQFDEFTYYEEVAACSSEYDSNPKGRVHMHGEVNDVIHVHDERVTYGQFFQNIGWSVGNGFIADRNEVYVADSENEVSYILNGEEVPNIASRVIESTDRLLVSYGQSGTDFDAQFENVGTTAKEVNGKPDPASCGGLNGPGHDSFTMRLKRATFWP